MKKQCSNNLDISKKIVNLFEIILYIYCILLFENYINTETFKVLNYSIDTKVVNSFLLFKTIENSSNVYANNFVNENTKKESIKNNLNLENKLLSYNTVDNINFSNKFERVSQVNIIKEYIKDILFLIVYYIYSKSRKKSSYISNSLCIN